MSLDRNALCFITIGKTKLGLLGLHLKSNPDDEYANGRRSAEAEIAGRVVRTEVVARGYTPIVLGDPKGKSTFEAEETATPLGWNTSHRESSNAPSASEG